jgi:hypothetical protein
MVIKKNFKIINDVKTEDINSQEIIEISEKEIQEIEQNLSKFFSSVKTLLREGAVVIDDGLGTKEEESFEEEFVKNPSLQNKQQMIFSIALCSLPQDKATNFANQIKDVKISDEFNFSIEMERESKLKTSLEQILSKEVKAYSLELPAIMKEREVKIKMLIEARPDIKLYLEGKKN